MHIRRINKRKDWEVVLKTESSGHYYSRKEQLNTLGNAVLELDWS